MAQQLPSNKFAAIVPSDTVNLAYGTNTLSTIAIYVGVAGDIIIVGDSGTATKLKAVPVGLHQISCQRVNATNTTATDMVAFF